MKLIIQSTVTFLFLVSYPFASQASENDYCPFGICKGVDPRTLFATEEEAELNFSNSSYGIGQVKGNYSENWKFIDDAAAKGIITSHSAAYSKQTGICSSHLTTLLPYNLSYGPIVEVSINTLIKETGNNPTEFQTDLFKNYVNLKWSGEKLGSLKGVSSIVLNYSTKSEFIDHDALNVFVWYDNYDDCRMYEPDIMPSF